MTTRHKDQLILVLACFCIVLAIAMAKPERVGGFSPDLPPASFESASGDIRLRIAPQSQVKSLCAIIKAPKGSIACGRPGLAIVPDYKSSGLSFVAWLQVLWHEIGHALGWDADHPRS